MGLQEKVPFESKSVWKINQRDKQAAAQKKSNNTIWLPPSVCTRTKAPLDVVDPYSWILCL